MWISKTIFTFSFLLQVLANYFVIQHRRINKNDIIKDVPTFTITSCQLKCSNTKKCVAIGFTNDPDLHVNNRSFIIKNGDTEGKREGPDTMMLFVLDHVSFYILSLYSGSNAGNYV